MITLNINSLTSFQFNLLKQVVDTEIVIGYTQLSTACRAHAKF
jgi:hypothetical protein